MSEREFKQAPQTFLFGDQDGSAAETPEASRSSALDVENALSGLFERLADMRAAAEGRRRRVTYGEPEVVSLGETPPMSGEEFLSALERRFGEGGSAAPPRLREEAADGIAKMRRLLEERRIGGDAGTVDIASVDDALRGLEVRLRGTELMMDSFETERRIVPFVFASLSAKALAEALRGGMEHPRSFLEVIHGQLYAVREEGVIPSPSAVERGHVSESLLPGYDLLLSKRLPVSMRGEAARAVQQVHNRFFAEASVRIEHVAASEDGTSIAGELRAFAEALREEDRLETERVERSFRLQGEMYAAIAEAHPERKAELDRRRSLEELFVRGEPIGEPEPLFPVAGGSGSPHKVTLKLGQRVESVLVKFAFAERFTRGGVEAGHGHWREVAGAAHAVGLGVDVPVVAARRLGDYGTVTVMELLNGNSCSNEHDWFLDAAGGGLRREVGLMAIDDYLKIRTDGAPRNIVKTSDGRLVAIDHGSDLPSDVEEPVSSAALYLVSGSRQTVPEEVRRRVFAWADSRERRVFERMLSLMPEQMRDYVDAYDDRLKRLVQSFVTNGPRATYPFYPVDYRGDFGKTFHEDAHHFFNATRAERAPAASSVSEPDITVARPRAPAKDVPPRAA